MGDNRANEAPAVDPGVTDIGADTDAGHAAGRGPGDGDQFDRLGAELVTVLRSAHEAAERTRVEARAEAASIVARAESEARERHEAVDAEIRDRRAAIDAELEADRARVQRDLEEAQTLVVEAQEVDREARQQAADLVAEATAVRDALDETSPRLADLLERADATMSRWGEATAEARATVGQVSEDLRALRDRIEAMPVLDDVILDLRDSAVDLDDAADEDVVVDLRDSTRPAPPPPPPDLPPPPATGDHPAVAGEDDDSDALSDTVRAAVSRAVGGFRADPGSMR